MDGIFTPTPETISTVQAAAGALEGAGAAVEERRPEGVEETMDLLGLYFWDGGAGVARLLESYGTTESLMLEGLLEGFPALTAAELDALLAHLTDFRSRMMGIFNEADIVLCPVNAGPALPLGAALAPENFPLFSYTFSYNMTGWPAVVVRGGTSPEGLPIGVQVLAAPAREDQALAVAKVIEGELGGYVAPEI